MSDTRPTQIATDQVLVELWTLIFGEPPPLVHDPGLMIDLLEAEWAERRGNARGAIGR